MNKGKFYSKIVRCLVYKNWYLFVIGGTPREAAYVLADEIGAREKMTKFIEEDDSLDCCATTGAKSISLPDVRPQAVWFPEVPVGPVGVAAIAHEAVHLTTSLMMDVGIEWSVHGTGHNRWVNDEPIAYLVEFFTREMAIFAEEVIESRKAKRRRKKA